MHVDFTWPAAIEEASVSEVTGLAAYRIVQEALSNAIRHAPGARVRVTGKLVSSGIDLDVVNEPAHATGQLRWRSGGALVPARPGQGVIGMIERATSVGGTVTAGPTDDGGFAIRAQLPLHPPPDRQ
jgi:signal transduction histidine kinase